MIPNYTHQGNQSFKDKLFSFDFTLVFAILFLGIISIFAMYSTEQGNFGYYTKSHLYRFCIFFMTFFIISFFSIKFWFNSAYLYYVIVLILLLTVYYFGVTASGSKRWINLFFINLQPSELMKVSLILFLVIVFPREYYDYKYLSQDIVRNFFSPATDDYATETFINSLRHGTGNPRYFPYWIFLPYNQHFFSLSVVTEIVGLSILVFLVNFKFKQIKKIVHASLIFFILALSFGQPMGRFFIEPFL